MEILPIEPADLEAVKSLITEVSETDVLPDLTKQGKATFRSRVLPDVDSIFDGSQFHSLKVVVTGDIVGFGALREGNYLTHLFVSKSMQGGGVGKTLLDTLLQSTNAAEISLRSSVNAVEFYKSYGFEAIDVEAEFNGIRFVPMCLVHRSAD